MKKLRIALPVAISLVALGFSVWRVPAVPAQIRIPSEAIESVAELNAVIQRGMELEKNRRWSELVTLYEDALKKHPNTKHIKKSLTRAKTHYDIQRRHADRSFRQTINRLTRGQALELYAEILQKISANYVQPPDWQKLVNRGVDHLHVAMGDGSFAKHYMKGVTPQRKKQFKTDLANRLKRFRVRNRYDARQVAGWTAQLADQQLGIPQVATILEFACGASNSLDLYSCFLTASQLEEVFSQIEGNFVGLGIEIKSKNQELEVVNVLRGSPALEAGIRTGDTIIQVADSSTRRDGTEAAADKLKGPAGTTVQLIVRNLSGDVRTLKVLRREIELPSITDVKMVDRANGIAYLKLNSFQKTTAKDLEQAMWKMHRKGMRCLIMDLRGNPGGLLPASVTIADKFIARGGIVSTRGRSAQEDYDYQAHRIGTWRVGLVVLIDGDSASASEILAGAVQDHRRATIVGRQSYGKGSVQGIFRLTTSRCGIRLTTAKFYSPNGTAISRRGIVPDVVVHKVRKAPIRAKTEVVSIPRRPQAVEDAILKAGIDAARAKVARK